MLLSCSNRAIYAKWLVSLLASGKMLAGIMCVFTH